MFARRLSFSALAVLLFTSPALSASITVPNYDFASPYVAPFPPYALAGFSTWVQSPQPANWTGTAQDWTDTAGVFVNVPYEWINNLVPSGGTSTHQQAAFVFATPGLEISQQLTSTFQVGESYQLTVGIAGGGYGMVVGCPMEIGLYYLNGNGNQVMVGAANILNTNNDLTGPGGSIDTLTDYQLTIPAVAASNAWAGHNIGIALLQTSDTSNEGGYWDIDNVRLVATGQWTGSTSGSTNWSSSGNWGGVPPVAGSPLTFANPSSGHTANTNDFPAGTNFAGITFAAGAPAFSLQGNAIQLSGSIANMSSASQSIGLGMQLVTGGGTIDTGTGILAITGALSGSASLTETGTGSLILSGSNTFTGGTLVQSGTLEIDGAAAFPTGGALTIGSASQSDSVFSTAAPIASVAPEPGTLSLLAACAAVAIGVTCKRLRGGRAVKGFAKLFVAPPSGGGSVKKTA